MPRQRDQLGDVHALVAHALDVLDDVQQRGDDPQVAGDGRLQREQREDPLVDLEVAAVDAVVVGDDDRRELDVLVLERLDHAVDRPTTMSSAPSACSSSARELVVEVRRRWPLAPWLAELPGDVVLGALVGRVGEDLLRSGRTRRGAPIAVGLPGVEVDDEERRPVATRARPAACCA